VGRENLELFLGSRQKIFADGAKMLDFRRATVFCLGYTSSHSTK